MTRQPTFHLTMVLPAFNRPEATEQIAGLDLPSLDFLLRFGRFEAQTMRSSECAAHFLWQGSLRQHACRSLGLADNTPAILASPVWLQMGMHHMDMLGAAEIGVSAEEAAVLCRGLSEFYEGSLQFHAYRPGIWLITVPQMPDWTVCPVQDVLGQNDGSVRAEGANATLWLQWQTEIQMWLHQQPLNAERNRQGLPAVNGAWLWQDSVGNANENALLFADGDWADAYAGRRQAVPYDWRALHDFWQEERPSEECVVYLDELATSLHTGDVWGYCQTIQNLETRWFAPLVAAIKSGTLASLSLVTDGELGGRLMVNAKAGRAFWKKQRKFAGLLGGSV